MAAKPAPKKNLSALKRTRQADKNELHNQAMKAKIKTYIKKLETAMPSKNKEEVESVLRDTIAVISSAASKGIIHKNTASRKISRITKKVNAAFQ